MRLAFQMFRKDVERLWWVILLTLILLAVYAHQDATRPVFVVGRANGGGNWLNLALPFAWSLLIALVVNQDPLAGDRQFWIALPCGRLPLALAKTGFIAAFIQLPYLLATAAILFVRGINPLGHLPHLFWKQLVLLALVLPAMAVAAVVKNVAQFLLVLITFAAALVLLSNRVNTGFGFGPDMSWDVRWELAVLILCVGALLVAGLQFVRRATNLARAIAVITAIIAASVYNCLPRDTSTAIGAAFSPAPATQSPLSIRFSPRAPDPAAERTHYNFQRTTVLIPIEVAGLTPDTVARFDQISLELFRANGERNEVQWPRSSDEVRSERISASLFPADPESPAWQVLDFYNTAVWNLLRSGPVTIKGRILARFYRPGARTTLNPVGRTDIAGLGYCVNTPNIPTGIRRDTMTMFECVSPEVAPREMRVWGIRGDNAEKGRYLRDRFMFNPTPYPQDPWLSPLHRGTGTFGLVSFNSWAIAPQTAIGREVIDYTISNLDLNNFVVHAPVQTEAAK